MDERNRPVVRRLERELHLHRLQNAEHLTGAYARADLDADGQNGPGHRRGHIGVAGIGSEAGSERVGALERPRLTVQCHGDLVCIDQHRRVERDAVDIEAYSLDLPVGRKYALDQADARAATVGCCDESGAWVDVHGHALVVVRELNRYESRCADEPPTVRGAERMTDLTRHTHPGDCPRGDR